MKPKEGKELKCARCKHHWTYRGASKWYASCPVCKTNIRVNQGDKMPTSANVTESD